MYTHEVIKKAAKIKVKEGRKRERERIEGNEIGQKNFSKFHLTRFISFSHSLTHSMNFGVTKTSCEREIFQL